MRTLLALLVCLSLAACGDDEPVAVIEPEELPDLDPADVVDGIDNPYLPFAPGARWVYEGESDGEVERIVVEVLDERREVMGVQATVVRDTVTVDGELVEDTHDWYAQDRDGNVWYLGEAVENYEDGVVVDTDGSFEAGVDGARAGIVMLAEPEVGRAYRQEHFPGEAEDMGEVLRVGVTTTVPAGRFDDVVVTEDWNPLEPETVEEKHYAPGVGMILEEHTRGEEGRAELVEHRPAPSAA